MLRHLAYFEALANMQEKDPEWRATTAGLVVLRLLDAWFEEGAELVAIGSRRPSVVLGLRIGVRAVGRAARLVARRLRAGRPGLTDPFWRPISASGHCAPGWNMQRVLNSGFSGVGMLSVNFVGRARPSMFAQSPRTAGSRSRW